MKCLRMNAVVLAVGVCSLFALSADAATLALYNGQDSNNIDQVDGDAASGYEANVTGAGLSASVLINGVGADGYQIGSNTNDHASAPYYQITAEDADFDNSSTDNGPGSPQEQVALDNDVYLNFTLTADAGQKLILDNISLSVGQGTGSNSQERGYGLYWSIDGFATSADALIADAMIDGYREGAGGVWDTPSVALGGAQAKSVEFRLYVFTGDGAGGGSNIEFDDIWVQGSVVAVPEPGTLALFVLGCTGAILPRKRKS